MEEVQASDWRGAKCIFEVEVGLLDLTHRVADDHQLCHVNAMKSLFKRVDAIGHESFLKLVTLSKTIYNRLNQGLPKTQKSRHFYS